MRRRRKKDFSVHRGRAIIITTGTKLLDTVTKYTFYGFNDDLLKTIN